MAREELVDSAVSFLQDPSVAASPLDKRRQFLESKNLTSEEIQLAFARAGDNPGSNLHSAFSPSSQFSNPPRAPSAAFGYAYGPPPGTWAPPAEPRRDWRDLFVAATVATGVGYGLYSMAKRWVLPLLAPPTPPQLTQDKENLDAQYNQLFALVEQLASDTAALQSAEAARTARLDAALDDLRLTLEATRTRNQAQEEQVRLLDTDIRRLHTAVPDALRAWEGQRDERLKEIVKDLEGLRVLTAHRVGHAGAGRSANDSSISGHVGNSANAPSTSSSADDRSMSSSSPAGVNGDSNQSASTMASGGSAPNREPVGAFDFESRLGKRQIPAWQLAAASPAPSPGPEGTDAATGP